MPHVQWGFTRRAVLKGAVAALAGGVYWGCDDDLDLPPAPGFAAIIGSLHIIGEGMYDRVDRMRTSLITKDRDALEELIWSKDLLIHIFLATGRLPKNTFRGAVSAPASDGFIKQVCDFHPIVGQFAPERNWDLAYDPEAANWFERMHRIPNPPEVLLYHGFFGHIIPCVRAPGLIEQAAKDKLFKMKNECEALEIENRYRRQVKLPEVPRKPMGCPSP